MCGCHQTLLGGKYQRWVEEDSEIATRLKRVAGILVRWGELSEGLKAKHPGDSRMQVYERTGLERSFVYQIGWLLNGSSLEDASTQVLTHSKAPVMGGRRAYYPDAISVLTRDFEFPGE